jgi:hypothetical protein
VEHDDEFRGNMEMESRPKAGMVLVEHTDANRHALLNTRKLPCLFNPHALPANPTLDLLVVVQGNAQCDVEQMRVGWRASIQRLNTGALG